MALAYINPETKELFTPITIHNFSLNRPNEVRICGSIKLNPEDNNYPDKKWVSVNDIYDIEPVVFDDWTIKNNTF